MLFVVDLNVFLLATGLPLQLFVPCELSCVPWATILGVFAMVIAFWASTTILATLANPFENKGGHDMISPDAYLADSEQAIFSMLRARYNMPPDGFVQENGALPEATLLVSQRALARLSTANSNASNAAPPHGDQ